MGEVNAIIVQREILLRDKNIKPVFKDDDFY